MADIVCDVLLTKLVTGFDWATADIRAAMFLADTWTPDKSDDFMLDVTGAGAIECAAASYARVALTSQTATLDSGGHRELLDSAVIDFGVLETGFDFDTLVLFVFVTNDTNSWTVAFYDVGAQTTDGMVQRFVPDTDGLFRIAQP